MKKNIKKIFKKIYKISYKLINNPNIEWVFYLRYIFHKKLDIKINDFKIRFSTKDIIAKKWFFPRYLNGEPHEPPVTQQLIKEFESDSIFFDIGANIGFFTILAQKKCNKGSVHAFEIDPELVKIINNNTKLNQGAEVFINCSAITKKTQDIISFNPQKDNNKSTNSIYDIN
ncbi:MAG: FkbM family methyltransferase [Candidatus Paceibacteria bacterium]